jgi:hypothetical protein
MAYYDQQQFGSQLINYVWINSRVNMWTEAYNCIIPQLYLEAACA